MKKAFAFALLGLSTIAVANTETQQPTQNQPMVNLAVYDISNTKEPKMVENITLSRSNKNHRLCWTAANVGAVENGANFVIEQFVTPTSIILTDDSGITAQRSKDGKSHLVLGYLPTFSNGLVEKCWQFPTKYPVGEYKFAVRVNDFEFPQQSFKIVK